MVVFLNEYSNEPNKPTICTAGWILVAYISRNIRILLEIRNKWKVIATKNADLFNLGRPMKRYKEIATNNTLIKLAGKTGNSRPKEKIWL